MVGEIAWWGWGRGQIRPLPAGGREYGNSPGGAGLMHIIGKRKLFCNYPRLKKAISFNFKTTIILLKTVFIKYASV